MNGIRRRFTGFLNNNISPSEDSPVVISLVMDVPAEVSQALDDVRRRYDPAFNAGIVPHITIKRPVVLPDLALLPVIRAYLRQMLLQVSPLNARLEGYGVFRSPGRNVVFLKIADETPFLNLHKVVLQSLKPVFPEALADQYEGEVYHPHLTIGNELNDLDLAVLEHELGTGGYRLNFSFQLEEVTLSVGQFGKVWSPVEVFTLAGVPILQAQE